MTLKSDAKFEEKLNCCLENDMKNFENFHLSTRKCQNWNFDKILLSKVENVWALNLQWRYVSWQWGMIQKLNRNWLVDIKLTWISQNLTRRLGKSKKIFFNWLLLTKVSIAELQKNRGVIFYDNEVLCKFWIKTDQWFEKKTWEIWQIFTRALESVKIGTLMGSFCPK